MRTYKYTHMQTRIPIYIPGLLLLLLLPLLLQQQRGLKSSGSIVASHFFLNLLIHHAPENIFSKHVRAVVLVKMNIMWFGPWGLHGAVHDYPRRNI